MKVKYWFSSKRYGWGWGLPVRWQGWATLIGFLILLGVGGFLLAPFGQGVFVAYTFAICVVLLVVCWKKGPPPAWRWGKDS